MHLFKKKKKNCQIQFLILYEPDCLSLLHSSAAAASAALWSDEETGGVGELGGGGVVVVGAVGGDARIQRLVVTAQGDF